MMRTTGTFLAIDYLSEDLGGWYIFGPDPEIINAYDPSDDTFSV